MCVYYYVTYYYSVSNMALTVAWLTLKCLGNQSHITTGFPKLDFLVSFSILSLTKLTKEC